MHHQKPPEAERRGYERTHRCLACEIVTGEERIDGLVMDFSAAGLYVLTEAAIEAGTLVDVRLVVSKDEPPLALRARVVRQSPGSRSRLVSEGLGLDILEAPGRYADLVGGDRRSLEEVAPPSLNVSRDETLRCFQVLVGEKSGERCRVLKVFSHSAETARQQIEEHIDPDWEVREVTPD